MVDSTVISIDVFLATKKRQPEALERHVRVRRVRRLQHAPAAATQPRYEASSYTPLPRLPDDHWSKDWRKLHWPVGQEAEE